MGAARWVLDDELEGGGVRLARLIASRGVASRRGAEELIRNERVKVGGIVVNDVAARVDPDRQTVHVDDEPLPAPRQHVYFVVNKPKGLVVHRNDKDGRKSLMDELGARDATILPVGTLEFNAEGAVILTNDHALAAALTRKDARIPRRYVVKVYRTPDERDLKAISRGVQIDEKTKSKPAKARVVDATDKANAWVELTTSESTPGMVQKVFEKLGHPVAKLRRESFGTISVRDLGKGEVRKLATDEVERLRDLAAGVPAKRAGRAALEARREELRAIRKARKHRDDQHVAPGEEAAGDAGDASEE